MDDKERLALVEQALAQMLKPVKGVPFTVVVKALAERQVIAVDPRNESDKRLIEKLQEAIQYCATELKQTKIRRPRPNEVGNDIEEYAIRALRRAGPKPRRPTSVSGAGKSTGYPDILFYDGDDRPTYLECKIYGDSSADTTMRSLYLSPSECPFENCHG